jgi:basic membrane protein A
VAAAVLAAVVALLALHERSRDAAATQHGAVTLALFGGRPDPNGSVSATQNTIELSLLDGLQEGVREGIHGRAAYVGGRDDAGLIRSIARVARRSGLVLIGATPNFADVAAAARRFPHVHFALIGGSVHDYPFPRNVTGLAFDDREVGYLAGYLAALEGGGRTPQISAVAGKAIPSVRHIAQGYRAGAEEARPGTTVRITYTGNFVDEAVCERAANHQIDAGSTVVFDIAGNCGFGALQAADTRGVWGIGVDSDLSSLGPHILASAITRMDSAVRIAMELYAAGRLPGGRDIHLNVGNDGVALVGMNRSAVSAAHRRAIARVAARMRLRDQARTG